MNGEAKYVMVCKDRGVPGEKTKFFFMDKDWTVQPLSEEKFLYPDAIIERPPEINTCFELASTLSKDFPFVRLDFYIVDHKIYFGEFTFTPAGAMDTAFKFKAPGATEDSDTILGKKLVLPQ